MEQGNKSASQSRNSSFWGYAAGITTGVTYGLNPLFAKPLLEAGVPVDTMLAIRYLIAAAILGIWILLRKENLKINGAQFIRLCILGLLFGLSSLFLFVSYNYIPAGLATTIVFLYPVLVALIQVFLRIYPTWQVWVAIIMTFAGVVILSRPSGSATINAAGLMYAGGAALAYAMYLIIVNRSRRLRTVSNHVLTFYALLIGSCLFIVHYFVTGGGNFFEGIEGAECWLNLLGLAIFPTLLSLLTIAISTRLIGATKTSVLGVFEPITAILVGCLCFGESLTLNVITGIAITVAAVLFMILTEKKKPKEA